MSKSYYILLTIVAAAVAIFFLGRWTGMGLGLNNQRVMRTVHEAWCRADDRHAFSPEVGLDSLFRLQLREEGLHRLRFRLDTVSLAGDSTVVLRSALRYFDDYERELEQRRTFVIPLDSLQGVRVRLLNLRAETVGSQLYYLLGTVVGFFFLAFGIAKQVDIIRRQDKLSQMREDFSYAMVHDMKTPITTLLIGLKTLRSGRLDAKPEHKQRHFDVLEHEAQHLLALTNKVLTLSKMEHRQLLLNKDWHELPPMVDELVNTFKAKAQKPVTFRIDLQTTEVYADMEFLKEAIANLIDNALKYSKDTVEVAIASRSEAGFVRISVRDNGIGIPLSAQRTIFDKFERVLPRDDGNGQKKVSGFGLGLNYVMNVAREHDGYVSVESVPGRFSEFTVSLPLPPEGSSEYSAVSG
ncbi:sensor histidine kinase [Mediterranea massiliensis]|uniref:sensor histidine kinase n=1 Tax=Mediterranea massiliensis TaxID=1841865 RepID=UPI0025A476A6|nr:HAMP domain-containing sensor histidine kinase [Mediterranea massiliensis]MDM8336126.1 HAMP domain-containing sensor histidine kinase [Mediterranea massiliensis]